jgi:hypothetical protein
LVRVKSCSLPLSADPNSWHRSIWTEETLGCNLYSMRELRIVVSKGSFSLGNHDLSGFDDGLYLVAYLELQILNRFV